MRLSSSASSYRLFSAPVALWVAPCASTLPLSAAIPLQVSSFVPSLSFSCVKQLSFHAVLARVKLWETPCSASLAPSSTRLCLRLRTTCFICTLRTHLSHHSCQLMEPCFRFTFQLPARTWICSYIASSSVLYRLYFAHPPVYHLLVLRLFVWPFRLFLNRFASLEHKIRVLSDQGTPWPLS